MICRVWKENKGWILTILGMQRYLCHRTYSRLSHFFCLNNSIFHWNVPHNTYIMHKESISFVQTLPSFANFTALRLSQFLLCLNMWHSKAQNNSTFTVYCEIIQGSRKKTLLIQLITFKQSSTLDAFNIHCLWNSYQRTLGRRSSFDVYIW